MYQPMYQHRRPRRFGSYFLPFLSIIILGLIAVLVFQIVAYFQEKRDQELVNKAAVKIVTGKAEMKFWGVDQWTNAIDGSILHEGDAFRTAPGSRVILTLLNGSVIRINSETEIGLTGLKTRDAHDELSIDVKHGDVWLKKSNDNAVRAAFNVTTPHLDIKSLGTVFAVSKKNNGTESVDVLDGKIQVIIKVEDLETGKLRTADIFDVELGQEINIGSSDITALQNRREISLLTYMSDEFRVGDWYTWNRSEDINGTAGLSVADAIQRQTGKPPVLVGTTTTAITNEVIQVPNNSVLTAPVVLSPSELERTTRNEKITISGTVSSLTDKIEATTYVGGKTEPYILRKYQSGSTNWTYIVAIEYGNLIPGSNRFTFVAIGKDGKRSEPFDLNIVFDKPKSLSDLSAPQVTSFNGTKSSETTEDSVKIDGTVGKGIVKLFINDFALTRYVPDSGTWTYYAKTIYGNLKEGVNQYSIYGVDGDGKTTPITKFTITKKPTPTTLIGTTTQPVPTPASAPTSTGPNPPL